MFKSNDNDIFFKLCQIFLYLLTMKKLMKYQEFINSKSSKKRDNYAMELLKEIWGYNYNKWGYNYNKNIKSAVESLSKEIDNHIINKLKKLS